MIADIALLFIFALYGGALYRWRGHASDWKKYFPRPWNQMLFALPYGLAALQSRPQTRAASSVRQRLPGPTQSVSA